MSIMDIRYFFANSKKKKWLLKKKNNRLLMKKKKKKPLSRLNIIRIGFVATWVVLFIIISFKFSGYDKRAMVVSSTYSIVTIYVFSISMHLAQIRNEERMKSLFAIFGTRFLFGLLSLFMLLSSTWQLFNIGKDVLIEGYTEIHVKIESVDPPPRGGFYQAKIRGYDDEYTIHPSYIAPSEVKTNKLYRVHMFPNSEIIVVISEE